MEIARPIKHPFPKLLRTLTETIGKGATLEYFRRERVLYYWLVNTRPEFGCVANNAAQVTEKTYDIEKINVFNKGVRSVGKSADVVLRIEPLDQDGLHLRVH